MKPRHRLQIPLRLAWPVAVLTIAYVLRASDERTEPEDESKVEAVDSKRPRMSDTGRMNEARNVVRGLKYSIDLDNFV